MQLKKRITRRDFVRLSGAVAVGATAAACAPSAPQVVKETVVVEKQVEKQVVQTQVVETVKEVEKVVTATPEPGITTPWGRVLPADAIDWEKSVHIHEGGNNPVHLDAARDIYNAGAPLNWATEPLVRRDENQQIVPALADTWKVADDASYVEFHIRDGAKWSDGEPITADDFVYTYKHLANPDLANPWAWYYYDIKGFQDYNQGKAGPEGIGVEKIDDFTFRVHGQNGPTPHLLSLLSYQAAVPVPQHLAEKDPAHWADTIEGYVSCGPWKPTEWKPNESITFEPNEMYNGPHAGGIRKIIIPLVAAGQAYDAFPPFLAREIDINHLLNAQQVMQARSDPALAPLLHFTNNFQSRYLQLDTLQPPLDNLKLRQALSHAIDRDTLTQKVMQGTMLPGYSMLPPDFPAYNPDLKDIQKFDLEMAKSLLAEAGYPEGKDKDGKQLELTLVSQQGTEQELVFVQQAWQEGLGIKVNLEVVDNGTWSQRRTDHTMQIFEGNYEYDYLDPANMLTSLWKSVNEKGSPRHNWINKQFDDLVTEAGKTADEAKRFDLYKQAEKILVEDVGGIFLEHQVIYQIWWPFLVGMHPDKNGNVIFRWLDIARYQMYLNNTVEDYRPVPA
jgi:oligopeptide transport system substrate-binding protein